MNKIKKKKLDEILHDTRSKYRKHYFMLEKQLNTLKLSFENIQVSYTNKIKFEEDELPLEKERKAILKTFNKG